MRAAPVLLLCLVGCWPTHPPAPEEEALDLYEHAEQLYAEKRYAEAAPEYGLSGMALIFLYSSRHEGQLRNTASVPAPVAATTSSPGTTVE